MSTHVLLNLLTSCGKEMKCVACRDVGDDTDSLLVLTS